MATKTLPKAGPTPGPYRVVTVPIYGDLRDVTTIASDAVKFGREPFPIVTPGSITGRSYAEVDANEKLLAASWDLLEACKGLVEWESFMGGWESPAWDRLRAAIAKAEGRA